VILNIIRREDAFFQVVTPLGFKISTSKKYWELVTSVKHPHISGRESDVIETLKNPDLIRHSKVDKNVHLFYKEIRYNNKKYHLCVVTNKQKEILITAYITDRIKEGIKIWTK
jgi:hypothetical protein